MTPLCLVRPRLLPVSRAEGVYLLEEEILLGNRHFQSYNTVVVILRETATCCDEVLVVVYKTGRCDISFVSLVLANSFLFNELEDYDVTIA